MHWGVRRYQPYSNGEHGKEVGEAERKRHGVNAQKAFKVANAVGTVALGVALARNKRVRKVASIIAKSAKTKINDPKFEEQVASRIMSGSKNVGTILGKSADKALSVVATGSMIYGAEQYIKYKYGEQNKIIKYGREPIKK